jgi:signal transduction histidine kinase
MEPLNINELLQEVLVLTRHEVLKNGVSLRTELADDIPLVTGDRVQLQQVILNLIMNAVKATSTMSEDSRDLVVASLKKGPNQVVIAVRDSGIGIDPENRDRLFEAFFTTKPAGMGMGLSISRSLIEVHGGRLWATPNEGPGATFQFSLPAAGAI